MKHPTKFLAALALLAGSLAQAAAPLTKPATKLEVGKTYVFENAYLQGKDSKYYYLSNSKAGEKLELTDEITENCVWTVEQGSVDGSVTIKNTSTDGFMFTTFGKTDKSAIDVYVFNADKYDFSIGLSISPNQDDSKFLNASAFISTGYISNNGSQWYAYEVDLNSNLPYGAVELSVGSVQYKIPCPKLLHSAIAVGQAPVLTSLENLDIVDEVSYSGIKYPVTAIATNAFKDMAGFSGKLTLGNNIKMIGDNAFYGCKGFTGTLELPDSLIEIGKYAFYGCSGFTGSLVFPDSIKRINYGAFENCTSFNGSLVLSESIKVIDNSAFRDCKGFTGPLILPKSIISIGAYVFKDCSGFTGSLEIPSSLTEIPTGAFWGCVGMRNRTLYIPATIESISDFAFYTGFKQVVCYRLTPPECTTKAFSKREQLFVPEESITSYKLKAPWSGFANITAIQQLEKIEFAESDVVCVLDRTIQLNIRKTPVDALADFSFTSDNPAVATVDADGVVSAISLGKAVITATCGELSATCTVTVVLPPAESITLSNTFARVKDGESIVLTAKVLPENAADKTVTWTSSNPAIAKVDANGKVTGTSPGDAVITARCGEVSATCSVKVIPTPAESINLSQTTAQLYVGESLTLTATVMPETTTDKTLTWTSSKQSVATVDANGNVTAVAIGVAVITVKCGNVSAQCSIKVVPTPAESINLSQTTAQLKLGESITLSATVLPETTTNKTLTWSSSNPAVAKVDSNGKVTAVALGEAVITAKCGEVSATCSVAVVATPVESITISQTSASLKVGESLALTATVKPDDATDKTIVWTTSDEAVATVDTNGKVTAVAPGEAEITAESGNVSATCSVTVVPVPVERITISQRTASLKIGETVELSVTIKPNNVTDKTVIWTSSNDEVATVDNNGKVIALSLGEAVITARCSDASATCKVSVVPTLVETITLTPEEWRGLEGETIQLAAIVLPDNATDKSLTWSSSDETVATVDANGLVIILKDGNCVITATAADGSGITAQCRITGLSGIDEILAADGATVDVYTASGVLLKKACTKNQLQQLTPGIYILRHGNVIAKIAIK